MPLYTHEYHINGHHREKLRDLTSAIFGKYIDVFIIAPIIGVLFQRTSPEVIDDQAPADIPIDVLYKHDKLITKVFRLVVLNDRTLGWSTEKKIDYLFRNLTPNRQAYDLFENYFRGGVEVLHEELLDGNHLQDPMTVAYRLTTFVEELNNCLKVSGPKDIIDICRNFPKK